MSSLGCKISKGWGSHEWGEGLEAAFLLKSR